MRLTEKNNAWSLWDDNRFNLIAFGAAINLKYCVVLQRMWSLVNIFTLIFNILNGLHLLLIQEISRFIHTFDLCATAIFRTSLYLQ